MALSSFVELSVKCFFQMTVHHVCHSTVFWVSWSLLDSSEPIIFRFSIVDFLRQISIFVRPGLCFFPWAFLNCFVDIFSHFLGCCFYLSYFFDRFYWPFITVQFLAEIISIHHTNLFALLVFFVFVSTNLGNYQVVTIVPALCKGNECFEYTFKAVT